MARLLVFVLAASLCPAVAQASIWSWLEELSGPGPFSGYMFSFTVPCKDPKGVRWSDCNLGTDNLPQTIVVRAGRYNSNGRTRFKDLAGTPFDDRRDVHVVPLSVLWVFHPHRSFGAGVGAGFMHVSGDGFDGFSKVSLTPLSVTFTPLAVFSNNRWAYVLRLEFDHSLFPQGFKGADFNNAVTTFDSGPELLTRTGIVFDLGAVIFHR
jgi:hypothetical protein